MYVFMECQNSLRKKSYDIKEKILNKSHLNFGFFSSFNISEYDFRVLSGWRVGLRNLRKALDLKVALEWP